jgi:hypothetical protein
MLVEEFLQNIKFRGIVPETEAEGVFKAAIAHYEKSGGEITDTQEFKDAMNILETEMNENNLNSIVAKIGKGNSLDMNQLDKIVTILPEEHDEYCKILDPILNIPRFSSFAIAAIIHRTVREMAQDTAYVNVGIWHGFSLFAGMLGNQQKKVIGIDNFSEFGGPKDHATDLFNRFKGDNHFLFELDYKDYFLNFHEGEIGFYYYDGDHSYENQIEGLRVAERYFARDCIIMVDDTNWVNSRKATLDFIAESSNKYEIIFNCRTACNCHPTFWNGIMIFKCR